MAAMHFQVNPLVGGYVTLDDCVVGWCGCGAEHSFSGFFCVFNTRLAIVLDRGMEGIPRARCLVSSLERIPLSCRRSQLISVVYPDR